MKKQQIIFFHHIIIKYPIYHEEAIKDLFTFTNPEYLSICNQRKLKKNKRPKGFITMRSNVKGRWVHTKIPEFLFYFEYDGNNLLLPRGAWFKLKALLNQLNQPYRFIGKRKERSPQEFKFHGKLDPERGQLAIKKYNEENGIVEAPTGSGKTVMACWRIAKVNVPTIIAVNTIELQNQWIGEIKTFLHEKAGKIGGGIVNIQPITVALIQTLKKQPKLLKSFGHLIVDEVHFVATESYGKIINSFFGLYVMGLSATPKRKDGKTRVMHWYCGKIATRIKYEDAKRCPCTVNFIPTEFEEKTNFRKKYATAMVELTNDIERNTLIKDTVMANIEIFGIHLILSSSSKHLYNIYDLFPDHIKLITRVLVGTIGKKERKQIVSEMKKGNLKIILATQQLLGTGFNEPLLSVLHLTTPIKDMERIKQYLGRITRLLDGKECSYLFDYFDKYIKLLKQGATMRSRLYSDLKLKRETKAHGTFRRN